MPHAIVIGAGHNGLAAAAYLARAGVRVRVLERRDVLGGACVTEELWPGFRISRASYVAGLLRPALIRELSLERHGLRLLRRDPSSYTVLPDGRDLLLGSDAAANRDAIRPFSARDAERYGEYEAFLDRVARCIEPLLDAPAPDPLRPRLADLPPLARAARLAWRARRDLPEALALLLGPARTALESWFESEPLRGTLATDSIIGAWAAPSTPGTGYVLFHHVMGETFGARGVWAYVHGGMGALSAALAAAATEAGAEIELERPIRRIAVENGRATGVELEDGRFRPADLVLSCADPHRTFLGLVGRDALPPDFVSAIEALDFRSPSLKVNFALDRIPRFSARPGDAIAPHHHGTIHVGATSLDELDASFAAAARGELPERPMVELTLPSSLDDGLAPAGRHVAGCFVQHVPWEPREGGWDAWRDRFADRVQAMIDEVAPGFSESVLHRDVLAPPDLERIFGLTGGNIFQGAMGLDRLAFLRPLPGWARHRTPIDGLYLCGAGAHPGGGVMGACGRNAARVVLAERGRSGR